MARIDKDFIENKIKKISISEYIYRNTSIELKKTSNGFKCNCPFHEEDTPSFHISDDENLYHCFGGGCGASGGIINFVMDYEHLEYVEAIKKIAEFANLSVEYENNNYFNPTSYTKDALTVYAKESTNKLKKTANAMKYLSDRGINKDTIDKFNIGLSLDMNAIRKIMLNENIKLTSALKADLIGLAETKDNKEKKYYYANFTDYKNKQSYPRLTFLITNDYKESVGIGARTLINADNKYKNTKKNEIFDKSSILYGYGLAKKSIRDTNRIIISEGYMDTVLMHQYGFTNTTAVMGTALTQQHIDMIKKDFGKNIEVVILLDGDNAGIKAGVKASKLLIKNDILGGVVKIPKGKDPADILTTIPNSFKYMENMIENNENLLKFVAQETYNNVIHKNDNQRTIEMNKLINELLSYKTEVSISNKTIADIFKLDIKKLQIVNQKTIDNQKIINSIAYTMINKSDNEIDKLFEMWANSPNEEAKDLYNLFKTKVDSYKPINQVEQKQEKVFNKTTETIDINVKQNNNSTISQKYNNNNNSTIRRL